MNVRPALSFGMKSIVLGDGTISKSHFLIYFPNDPSAMWNWDDYHSR
jgi:hypothetical protein